MIVEAGFVVWPLLLIVSALVPVLVGLYEYRRSR
jgi:hypothetical protein